MSEPLVCAVMLTRDRPEMAARAVRCFREQTYKNKRLLIHDNSENTQANERLRGFNGPKDEIWYCRDSGWATIGALRNRANECMDSDIICAWDDDDYSHSNRIAEQVALLKSSKAECVGYHSMYFWEAGAICRKCGEEQPLPHDPFCRSCDEDLRLGEKAGRAFLYSGEPPYAIGTSLCYWRSTWENRPFLDVPIGEDSKFLDGTSADGKTRIAEPLRVASVSANKWPPCETCGGTIRHGAWDAGPMCPSSDGWDAPIIEPRMVARIHPDSLTYKAGYRRRLEVEPWSRVTDPAVMEHCRKAMEL